MAAPAQVRTGGGWLARGAFALALPVACLALIVLFAVAQFPYDRFRATAEDQLRAQTGADAAIGSLSGGLSIGGPALHARDVRLAWPDGSVVDVEHARVRPAWSLSWLRGQPALHVDLRGSAGRVYGTVWPNDGPGFRGRAEELNLADLPPGLIGGPSPILGVADADIQLRVEAGSTRGTLQLEAREGSLAGADLPMAIPYESLVAEARFGEGGAVELVDVALDGPLLAATGGGNIGAAPLMALASLDLDFDLEVVDANVRPVLRSMGVRLDGEGRTRLRVTGTVGRPIVR